MRKSFICFVLVLALALGALPFTAAAADTQPAATGETFYVFADYNKSDHSVSAIWDSVYNAASYTVWLTNYDEKNKDFFQVGLPLTVSASGSRSCSFDSSYLYDYGWGGKYYRVRVIAYDSNKNQLAWGLAEQFLINDIPMLGKPVITFSADGIVTWTNVSGAEKCRVTVVDTQTYQGNYVDVACSLGTYDMSRYMTNGKTYYATCTAMTEGYRNNRSDVSETVTADIKPAVTGLKWNSGKLSWTAFPGANHYIIYLEKYNNSTGVYEDTGGYTDTIQPLFDATVKMNANGYGTYRATVLAMKGSAVISAPTQSDEIIRYQPTGNEVSGVVASFLDADDEVKITLRNLTVMNATAVLTVKGNIAPYTFPNLLAGNCLMYVSKPNHVTRTYNVMVSGAQTMNIVINPIGDVSGDGKVTTVDFGKANAHAKNKSTLTGYEFSCADVTEDGKVTTADAGKINSHARNKTSLWK